MGYYDQIKDEITNLLTDFGKSRKDFDRELTKFEEERRKIEDLKKDVKKLAQERQIGFPWLAKAYDDFFRLQDKQMVDFLKYKNQPAIKASDIVKEYSRLRREAEKNRKIYQYLVEYYEAICPFLLDLKEEVADIREEEKELLSEYTAEELEDKVTNYLTKEEYRALPSVKKNQLALDRYWARPKSKWHIGKIYERYVGYLYEEKGYDVDYVGIFQGLKDLGRDLIAKKGKEIIVIQCKNWSKFKTIYERHIFQFFGTVFKYRDENKDKKVEAVFYSATKLSDLARRFAQELEIELKENFKMDNNYPCIKCNISRIDGTKIYHLPFDQQYDNTKVEKKRNEFYCETAEEAERKGFRRAFKYKGFKKEQ